MAENILNARLQHAVIGEGSTTTSSIPKTGEIIFNSKLNNCKVGDGYHNYTALPFLIPEHKVLYKIPTTTNTLEGYLMNEIWDNYNTEGFSIDVYNHIVIADINNNIDYTWSVNGVYIYSVCSENPNLDNFALYNYLRENPYKTLKITFMKPSMGDMLFGLFQNTGSSTSTDWIYTYLSCVNNEYQIYQYHIDDINNISGIRLLMNTSYTNLACQSIKITCVDPINNKFLIE